MSTDAFRPPPRRLMEMLWRSANLWFPTELHGLEHYDPRRPTLFVGNHTIYGLIDIPLLVSGIYLQSGSYLRGLGDHIHFMIPGWRELLRRYGGVEGTRENCAALMQAGQPILVYPGGGREVMKRKGEAYTLIWKKRTGFARMAIAHGYDILPFASVGAEETYDILIDANDILRSPVGRMLDRAGLIEGMLRGGDALAPLATGIGPTLLPKPQPFHFVFGTPISTGQLRGQEHDEAALWRLREEVATSIEGLLDDGKRHAADTRLGPVRRLLTR